MVSELAKDALWYGGVFGCMIPGLSALHVGCVFQVPYGKSDLRGIRRLCSTYFIRMYIYLGYTMVFRITDFKIV